MCSSDLYIDETVMRMCYTHRHLLADLALQLVAEGKKDKALKVLQKAEKVMPAYNVPYNYVSGAADLAKAYALIGQKTKARSIINQVWKDSKQFAKWYVSLGGRNFSMSQDSAIKYIYMMQATAEVMELVDLKAAQQMMKELNAIYAVYQAKGGAPLEG